MGSTLSRLGQVGALDVAIQFACFVVAAALKTEKFYDFSASCTYILLILFSYNNFKHDYLLSSSSSSSPASFGPTRSFINSTLVCLWAARLGSFLLRRILHDGKDSRFDKVRDRPSRFFVYWMVQALWIFLTALPVYIINCNKDDALSSSSSSVGESPLGVRDVVGWSMWVIGFLIESTADAQKTAFKNNPRNKGKFIDTGLWSLSQHPNYFGEMLLWWGMFLSSTGGMRNQFEYLSIISPIFVQFLLMKVSGIPLLQKANWKKWGNDPSFRAYLARTNLLIPLPKFF